MIGYDDTDYESFRGVGDPIFMEHHHKHDGKTSHSALFVIIWQTNLLGKIRCFYSIFRRPLHRFVINRLTCDFHIN